MVFWKGVFVGGTPLERADVEAGTAQIVLVLPRYEPIFAVVTVPPGQAVVQELAFAPPTPAFVPSPTSGGGDRGGGDRGSGCSQAECTRDCFQDGFHCKAECGSSSKSCEFMCRKLEDVCDRSCERDCR
jgi:hypothetical protein